jgi:hypothetical protein
VFLLWLTPVRYLPKRPALIVAPLDGLFVMPDLALPLP